MYRARLEFYGQSNFSARKVVIRSLKVCNVTRSDKNMIVDSLLFNVDIIFFYKIYSYYNDHKSNGQLH